MYSSYAYFLYVMCFQNIFTVYVQFTEKQNAGIPSVSKTSMIQIHLKNYMNTSHYVNKYLTNISFTLSAYTWLTVVKQRSIGFHLGHIVSSRLYSR